MSTHALNQRTLDIVLPLLRCPDCATTRWRLGRNGESISCEGCGATSQVRGDILWLNQRDVHAEVREERTAVKPTEENPTLGGWRERYVDRNTVEPGLRDAYLSLPYSNGSERFTEPGYFANVSRFAPEFDFLVAQLPSTGRLLDLGADGTWSTARLAKRGFTCVAVDITDHLTLGDLYQTANPHYARVNIDMHAGVFVPGSFDVVTAFNALHHSKRLPELARRIASHLRDGGTLAFVEPYVQCEPQSAAFGEPQTEVGINENIHTINEWHHAFQDAGLSLVCYAVSDAFTAVYRKAPQREKNACRGPRQAEPASEGEYGDSIQDGMVLAGYYNAELAVTPNRVTMRGGEPLTFSVQVRNNAMGAWASRGPWPVRLGYHVSRKAGDEPEMIAFDNPRTEFNAFIAPGQTATLPVTLSLAEPGEYVIEFDLVQEGVTWFEERGATTCVATCTVR